MAIQERLLMEQIDLAHSSFLGKKIMGERKPETVEVFRQTVPITTYADYEPYLSEQREDVLAEKPYVWMHTSGRSGRFKWVPYTRRMLDVASRGAVGLLILAAARRRGEVNLRPGQRMLLLVAPKPYFTGTALDYLYNQRFTLEPIPPPEEAAKLEFRERLSLGFSIALRTGFDHAFTMASVMAKVGEAMSNQASTTKLAPSLAHPSVLLRLGRAWLRAKSAGRGILPHDLWQPKSILSGGADAQIYFDDIVRYWGQRPWEAYAATETHMIAGQSWTRKGLTFVPNLAFWEFIPAEERRREANEPGYRPATVLFNELRPGEEYEVVFTHFYGMPLLRYRLGDVVKCIGLRDEEAKINLPQVVFRARVGDIIQLSGLTELDERTLWQAIVNTGVKIEDWSACKEFEGSRACVRVFVEPKETVDQDSLALAIDAQLKALDADYRDLEEQLGFQPVRVTLLSSGTFGRYYEEMRHQGADLAHLKPPHMNPSYSVVQTLLRLGG